MRLKAKFDKDKLFFTSDQHFFHNNIIKYCDRPFNNIDEMNSTIIQRWNEVVPEDGVVFNLGDVSLGSKAGELNDVLRQLNGTKHLIIGNHEKDVLSKAYLRDTWDGINDILEIYVPDEEITYQEQHIVMCHYPMMVWNGSHRGSWQLFGHVHGALSNKDMGIRKVDDDEVEKKIAAHIGFGHKPTQLDVGVDCHNFYPVSYQQVKEQITKQHLKN